MNESTEHTCSRTNDVGVTGTEQYFTKTDDEKQPKEKSKYILFIGYLFKRDRIDKMISFIAFVLH
jgi:hypothetical protein